MPRPAACRCSCSSAGIGARRAAVISDLIAEHIGEFAARNIDIVAVTHEPASDLNGRIYPFPISPDPNLELAAEFDLVGIDEFGKRTIRPATILIDESGLIRFSYVGDDSRDRPTIPALLLALDHLV